MSKRTITYAQGIRTAYEYLLSNHKEFFIIGQGVWAPWYVGASMTDLDKNFGKDRVIDCPVSELATTGCVVGASMAGYRPMIVHPRVDFMVLAIDQIVTQAAKWRHMFGGKSIAPATFRAIINRAGEQGAQHSQSLHSWFAHVPGLRVVMPYSAADARDLMVAAVLSDDPVLYLDDRWLYEQEGEADTEVKILDLSKEGPKVIKSGSDITLVGSSYVTHLCFKAAEELEKEGISCEVIDLRVINPLEYTEILKSVKKTKNLLVVDGSWKNCGLGGEIIAGIVEKVNPKLLESAPQRITLPDAPAPTSKVLEQIYYIDKKWIYNKVLQMLGKISVESEL
jgi:acetoin:2,6-dichlorophenolindophenol oxidoreductase subunit beta